MSKSQVVLLGAMVGLSFVAFAEDKKEAKMQTGPSRELESWMKPVEGTWNCDTKYMAGAMGPGSPEMTTKAKVKFSKDKETNGIFYRGEWSVPATKAAPAMAGTFLIAHDDQTSQLKNVSWDNMGGVSMGMGILTADTLSWSGESVSMGQKMRIRETMTKTSARTATHKFEADMGKGFQLMSEDVCTKVGTT